MNRALIFFTIILLSSCSLNRLPITQKVSKIGEERGMAVKIYQTKNFDIFTLQKISEKKSDLKKPIRIYIEGDGHAYINRYRPSPDPTPENNFLMELVEQDNSPNIVYIARPCQYVDSKNCEEKYWTAERFSPEVIESIQEVVNSFPSNRKLELVGYSGAAVIIFNLDNKNIQNIRTIAGNLDLEKFAELHKIPKFNTLPLDYKRLSKIRQTHFVGAQDKITTVAVFQAYKQKMTKRNCVNLRIILPADHDENWQKWWSKLLEKKPLCR